MKRLVLFICLVAMVFGVRAVTQYREFEDAQGRTIRACILAYDAANGIVMIERDSRRTAKVPITIFSEADQTYIREWAVLRCFTKESSFKISANRKKDKNEKKSYASRSKDVDVLDTWYEILLENRSSSELKGLELEYCIYYEQDQKNVPDQGVYYGELLAIDSIAPASNKKHFTESVSTYKSDLDGGYYYVSGADSSQNGKVHGIWIRVHLTNSSGQKQTRELCIPDSLGNSRSWTTNSIRAGMN